MKASKLFVCCLLSAAIMPLAFASNDSLRISELEKKLQSEIIARDSLSLEVFRLNGVVAELKQSVIVDQKRTNDALSLLSSANQRQSAQLDTLSSAVEVNRTNLCMTAEKLGVEIQDTNILLREKADNKAVKQRTIIGILFFVLFAIICAFIYILLHMRITKGSADIEALRKKAEKLNEEIVGNFSAEMIEMQKISVSLTALSSKSEISSKQDHSLIKTLADRITFMEMTLLKMDASVRGYKQLAKSINQMKDNLTANGYELVDMLGKVYKEGMNVTAIFVDDDSIEEGKQIITGIIKPQINYKGVMIQAAQITVSQNI